MSHSKVYFVILSFTFLIASTSLASDSKNSQFRYLAPLSTNLKQQQGTENSDKQEPMIHDDDFIYRKDVPDFHNRKDVPEVHDRNFKDNLEFVIQFSKNAADKVRESELKVKQIEREVMKRRLEGERELKKLVDRIDREHRKYIVEMEREQKKHRAEMERAYRKRLKELEED
jgi:hypothetical protein